MALDVLREGKEKCWHSTHEAELNKKHVFSVLLIATGLSEDNRNPTHKPGRLDSKGESYGFDTTRRRLSPKFFA
jgi:hypothetical protein